MTCVYCFSWNCRLHKDKELFLYLNLVAQCIPADLSGAVLHSSREPGVRVLVVTVTAPYKLSYHYHYYYDYGHAGQSTSYQLSLVIHCIP